MIIKSRKVGDSMILSLPQELNVSENTEFEVSMDSEGNILLTRVSNLTESKLKDIHQFMDQFEPLMKKLKDK